MLDQKKLIIQTFFYGFRLALIEVEEIKQLNCLNRIDCDIHVFQIESRLLQFVELHKKIIKELRNLRLQIESKINETYWTAYDLNFLFEQPIDPALSSLTTLVKNELDFLNDNLGRIENFHYDLDEALDAYYENLKNFKDIAVGVKIKTSLRNFLEIPFLKNQINHQSDNYFVEIPSGRFTKYDLANSCFKSSAQDWWMNSELLAVCCKFFFPFWKEVKENLYAVKTPLLMIQEDNYWKQWTVTVGFNTYFLPPPFVVADIFHVLNVKVSLETITSHRVKIVLLNSE